HSWIAVAFPVVGGAVIGLGLAELRVKVQRVLRQRMRESTIVEIEIEGIAFFLAIIADGNQRVLLKWHWKPRVKRVMACGGQDFGFPNVVIAQTKAEEIAERRFHAGRFLSIP